jgi:sulfate adenylyltransferase
VTVDLDRSLQFNDTTGRHPVTGAPRRGVTIFFTGLSGAGKSTLASLLCERLADCGRPDVTLLDGDVVRMRVSADLSFTREHRDLHIRRVGDMAQAVTKNGGIAVCAVIAPYDEARRAVRAMIAEAGGFVLVHVATPLAVCEQRDPKGLYVRARAGAITNFTGISDPYEVPSDAEITVDTSEVSAQDAVDTIVLWLQERGLAVSHSLPRDGLAAPPAAVR